MLQLWVSVSVPEPEQPAPPQYGEGLVQVLVRVLVWVPPPHEAEQELQPLQLLHPLQPPLTGQHWVLQLWVSVTEFPHWFVFVLVWVPPPQLAEQAPHEP